MSERDDPQHQAHIAIVNDELGYCQGYQYLCACQAVGDVAASPAGAIRDHFGHLMVAEIRPKQKDGT